MSEHRLMYTSQDEPKPDIIVTYFKTKVTYKQCSTCPSFVSSTNTGHHKTEFKKRGWQEPKWQLGSYTLFLKSLSSHNSRYKVIGADNIICEKFKLKTWKVDFQKLFAKKFQIRFHDDGIECGDRNVKFYMLFNEITKEY